MAGVPRRSSRKRWSPIERELRELGGQLIAGIDEVGRGPLAGPVVACAVIMPPGARAIAGVDDSKRLTPAERLRLARKIASTAIALGIGAASVREIERVNIYHATVLAMRRALARLSVTPDHVLIDGRPLRTLPVPHTAVVGGDSRCFSVACASIIAKVTRDRLMTSLARRHPAYLWERNAGYGTPEHHAGIRAHGITAHHRRTFAPLGQFCLELDREDDALGRTIGHTIGCTTGGADHGLALGLGHDDARGHDAGDAGHTVREARGERSPYA